MNKYISHVTVEQFKTALDLLENTWTQIEYTDGEPKQKIEIYPNRVTLVDNLVDNDNNWQLINAIGGIVDPPLNKYNKFLIRSYYNNVAQEQSKYIYPLNTIANHKYYISAFIDGIVSNENLTTNIYNSICNRYGLSFETIDGNDVIESIYYQDLEVHRPSYIITAPNDLNDYCIALYANNTSTALDARIYFGCVTAVDLTETFGEGNEPSVDWCDQYLDFYIGDTGVKTIKVFLDSKTDFLSGEFNEYGKCIISVPGYGTYTGIVLNNLNEIVHYDIIKVDKVKRYTISVNE